MARCGASTNEKIGRSVRQVLIKDFRRSILRENCGNWVDFTRVCGIVREGESSGPAELAHPSRPLVNALPASQDAKLSIAEWSQEGSAVQSPWHQLGLPVASTLIRSGSAAILMTKSSTAWFIRWPHVLPNVRDSPRYPLEKTSRLFVSLTDTLADASIPGFLISAGWVVTSNNSTTTRQHPISIIGIRCTPLASSAAVSVLPAYSEILLNGSLRKPYFHFRSDLTKVNS